MRAAQDHFGFTAAEIDAFPDHRGLLALEYAGRALRAETAEGLTPAQRVVKKAKGKVMAPGAVTHNRSVVKKQRVAERKQAQTTGDYRDVAKLLVQSAPKRR